MLRSGRGKAPLHWLLALALTAATAQANADQALYKHCSACHQADGSGTPGLAPPLTGAHRERLLRERAAAAQERSDRRAAIDYMLHCSGCHGMDGSGVPAQGIPDFRNQIGYFQRLPEGRAFLMQVPGLLNAGLPDDRRAALTTWLVRTFAGPSLAPDAQPYTAAEAREYRENRPADIAGTRKRLYEELRAAGYAIR